MALLVAASLNLVSISGVSFIESSCREGTWHVTLPAPTHSPFPALWCLSTCNPDTVVWVLPVTADGMASERQ